MTPLRTRLAERVMAGSPHYPAPGDVLTFWKQLLEKTRLQMSLFRGVSPQPGPEMSVRQGALRWSFVVGDDSSLVVLQVAGRPPGGEGASVESPAVVAGRLQAHRSEIESLCGARLIWRPSHAQDQPSLVIIWRVEEYGPGTTGDWPALQDALVNAMARLHRACRPYLAGAAIPPEAVPVRAADPEGLPQRFAEELITAYFLLGEETGYRPEAFLRVASRHGGFEAARRELQASQPSEALDVLRKLHRLDVSVEAFVLRPEYAPLFSAEELKIARERLRSYGYPV
jgi:hypothetical protein